MNKACAVFVVLVLAACSSGDLANNVLVGKFGGTTAAVTATHTSARFDFICGPSLQIAHPVVVDPDGGFTVSGTLPDYTTSRDTLPVHNVMLVISGHVLGDSLDLKLSTPAYAYGPSGHVGVRLGVPYTGGGAICRD